ncbi:MAG: DUF421 domain-containing protein [Chloroflexi bacterium]|nr:DUF421 domain-containing protein [Chloroflexota bacterium]
MKDLWQLGIPAWDLVLRCVVIYLLLLFGLRLAGKREIGQFALFDLVVILLVANAVQPAMTGPDSSLLGGAIIIATLLLLNFVVSRLRRENTFFRNLIEPHPTVLAQDGHWIQSALQREDVDTDEAEAALREHGVASIQDVKLAVLELDGTISVVTKNDPLHRGHRRVRYRHARQQ